jgi:hypothetical protein
MPDLNGQQLVRAKPACTPKSGLRTAESGLLVGDFVLFDIPEVEKFLR